MRFASTQLGCLGAEGQFARMRRDVDVACDAIDGVGLNVLAARKEDIGMTVKQARKHPFIVPAHNRRMRYARQCNLYFALFPEEHCGARCYTPHMKVEEIAEAIARLPPDQLARFRRWFAAFEAGARRDRAEQFDSTATKLGRLAGRALAELKKRAKEPLSKTLIVKPLTDHEWSTIKAMRPE
jgi:hypothetical protein